MKSPLLDDKLSSKHPRVFFYENCLKTAPIESKVDFVKLGHSLVLPTVRSCS
jgi:hypothetical protein